MKNVIEYEENSIYDVVERTPEEEFEIRKMARMNEVTETLDEFLERIEKENKK